MHVLVIGSGAREHALLLALRRDPEVDGISVAPGNAGTSAVADLGIDRVADAIRLGARSIVPIGDDVLLAWDVAADDGTSGTADGGR